MVANSAAAFTILSGVKSIVTPTVTYCPIENYFFFKLIGEEWSRSESEILLDASGDNLVLQPTASVGVLKYRMFAVPIGNTAGTLAVELTLRICPDGAVSATAGTLT
jgi:hypothetical protein